ncbi:MAG: hypothetical protein FWF70_07745 [Bacteroidetes bacterium]|nr:hypothetical protein [Bacteroidota bacterium]MCL1968119.1 hypothetical protein [Bacteroidota bacterium]
MKYKNRLYPVTSTKKTGFTIARRQPKTCNNGITKQKAFAGGNVGRWCTVRGVAIMFSSHK